jgi:hypothetical protein
VQLEFPTQAPKSPVPPSPVIVVDGKVTVVPLQPPVTLQDTVSENFTAAPLAVVTVAGLMETPADPAAPAGPVKAAMPPRRARQERIAATGRD